jgi:hypothetical protein
MIPNLQKSQIPNNMSPPTKTIGTRQERDYIERSAVRLILRNASDQIAIIFASKGQYYKLPGDGIEGSVDKRCVATTEEWRFHLHQISYCYEAKVVEDTGRVELTEGVEEGLKHEWCDVGEAMSKLRGAEPTSELGRFIQERDVFFLEQIAK